MKNATIKATLVTLLLSASICAPASARGLLGIIGDGDSGALITIESGEAGDSGAVNLGLGGGSNLVDANVGPQSGGGSLVEANVSRGGGRGLLSVGADVLDGTVRGNVGVVGNGGLLDVDIGIGGPGTGGARGLGVPGGPGGPGIPSGPGNLGGPGGSNGLSRGGFASNNADCRAIDPMQMVRLFERTSFSGWNRASSIQIVPVSFCPELRQQFTSYLSSSPKYSQIQAAVSQDALISTAISRTDYNQRGVFAVDRNGQQLVVYIY